MTSSYGIFPAAHQMAPLIDDSELPKPLTLRLDDSASIVVRITGLPKPTVRWQVGRKRVKESPRYHVSTDGDRVHVLEISRVTRDLEQGVWVVATNVNGEDCCLIEVRTFEIVLKQRHSAIDQQQSVPGSRIINRAGSLQRIGSFSNSSVPVKRGGSILSLKQWKQEMAIRNKMRSVDDLVFSSDKASLMSGLGYSLSVDIGDSDDPDLDEQFHTLSRHRPKRPVPVTTTRLVFAEVEPSRLIPVPNRSTTTASRSEEILTKETITVDPEQTEDECAKQSSKRKQKRPKKSLKTSISTPDPSSTPERPLTKTTHVNDEECVSSARSLLDLRGPQRTYSEDVWQLDGERLADVCQKMLQMFPEMKMQTADLKDISFRKRPTFEERGIIDRGTHKFNDSVEVMHRKTAPGVDVQVNRKTKIDKEEIVRDKFKLKSQRVLQIEGDNKKDDDEELFVNELSANESFVSRRKLKTAKSLATQRERNEMPAVGAIDHHTELSYSAEPNRRFPKKSHSLNRSLNSEFTQQEPMSVSDATLHMRLRTGSARTRSKLKTAKSLATKRESNEMFAVGAIDHHTEHPESKSEFSQDMLVSATQDNETDADNSCGREAPYDDKDNIATVCEVSAEAMTKLRSKQKKIGNRRSLQLAATGTKTQTNGTAKKAKVKATKSARVEHRAIRGGEQHEANRTFEENEALLSIRAFAEIEERTSEQVEHETRTSKTGKKLSTLEQAKGKAKASTKYEAGMPEQTKNPKTVHGTKTHKMIKKKSGKVNSLRSGEQNSVTMDNEYSFSSENNVPDGINSKHSSLPALLTNAKDSVDADATPVKEMSLNSGGTGTVISADNDDARRINLKPAAKKKRRKTKTSSISKVFMKSASVDRKRRKNARVQDDLSNHVDLEEQEDVRDSGHLENSEQSEDPEAVSEEEIIVQMDREPRSGVRRPDGATVTVSGHRERGRTKGEGNATNASWGVNSTGSTLEQVENIVDIETRDATGGKRLPGVEEEFEEQIIAMEREPRGGIVNSNRGNIEPSSVAEVTADDRAAGIFGESLDLTRSLRNLRQNRRPSANSDQNTKQKTRKGKSSSNADSLEIIRETVQLQEVSSRKSRSRNDEKMFNGSEFNVLKAAESSTQSRNPMSAPKPESSEAANSDFKTVLVNKRKNDTTEVKEVHQDKDVNKKSVRQLNNKEDTNKRTKESIRRSSRDAEDANESNEGSGTFLRSVDSSGHPSTAANERQTKYQYAQPERRESSEPSLHVSAQLKNEPMHQQPIARNLEREIKEPNSMKSSSDLNTIVQDPGFRAQHSENTVHASSSFKESPQQHHLSQVTSTVQNKTMDQENDMTSEQTLILKALAERIRCGQVEIIIVNKLTTEEKKEQPASENLLDAYLLASNKADVSIPPMPMTKKEDASMSTKYNEIKFIDSDDSADILEQSDQVSRSTASFGTVSNVKHIDSVVPKVNLKDSRELTAIPEAGLDLLETEAISSKAKLNLLETMPDLPVTKVDLSGTKVDSPVIEVNLPKIKGGLSETKIGLPETVSNIPSTKLDVYTDLQKPQMQNGKNSGTMFGVHNGLLPVSRFVSRDMASSRTSERNGTPTAVPFVNNTLGDTIKINTLGTRTQSSKMTNVEHDQKETCIKAFPHSIPNPTTTRKIDSVEVGIVKLDPPKPKPRNSISDGRSGMTSTNPSAINQTQHRNPPRFESNGFEGSTRLVPQMQPQPSPRAKQSTMATTFPAQLSNYLAPTASISKDKPGPNELKSSESKADTDKISPLGGMQVNSDAMALPKESPLTDECISVAIQATTTSDNDSSVLSFTPPILIEKSTMTTNPIEKSFTATQAATGSIIKSSTATQVALGPVRKSFAIKESTGPIENSPTTTQIKSGPIGKSSKAIQVTAGPIEKSFTASQVATVPAGKSSIATQVALGQLGKSFAVTTAPAGKSSIATQVALGQLGKSFAAIEEATRPIENSPITTHINSGPIEKSSTASQVAKVSMGTSSTATQVTPDPVRKSSTATQLVTVPTERLSAVTQITEVPVEEPSAANQVEQTSDKNSSSISRASSSATYQSSYTTPSVVHHYRPIIGNRPSFTKRISPAVRNIDRVTLALSNRYTPSTPYVSSLQNSWWNVYQRKFAVAADYARDAGFVRDVFAETAKRDRESEQVNTTAPPGADHGSEQLCDWTENATADFSSERVQDVINNRDSFQQSNHSEEQGISEQTMCGQYSVDVNGETEARRSRQSPLSSTNGYHFEESTRAGQRPVAADANDAGSTCEQHTSSLSVSTVKDPDSSVSVRTQEAVIGGSSGFELRNNCETETTRYESRTERNTGEYVSRVVTHEYGELIVLYPAT